MVVDGVDSNQMLHGALPVYLETELETRFLKLNLELISHDASRAFGQIVVCGRSYI
jgi:hypothetical protein